MRTIHGETRSRLYFTWMNMKQRCSNPNKPFYQDYGGRGIRVCNEWLESYLEFRDWAIRSGYDDTLQIDRIDVNGNYEPSNCRWVTTYQQSANRRKNRNGRTSPFRGVSWHASGRKWTAQICRRGYIVRIGDFDAPLTAALAYDDYAFDIRGEFARLNFPERRRAAIAVTVNHISEAA